MDAIEMKVSGPVQGSIRPPGSKSITNRALVCAALADGNSTLHGCLDSEDTRVMVDAWQRLGIELSGDIQNELTVKGLHGTFPVASADLFVANSGTTIRFLTAALCLGQGSFRLDGIGRMRQRPIGDLLDALVALGATVVSESDNGCPPVSIQADGLRGGQATVRGNISSQFLSGLLMAAPYAAEQVEIQVEGKLVSQPYVRMTLEVMRAFGVQVRQRDLQSFHFAGGETYQAVDYHVEPDASAASYFWAAAAVTGGDITVEGLTRQALQGDVAFVNCLEQMGCRVVQVDGGIQVSGSATTLRGIDVDMNAISDTVQTLAAVALFAKGPTRIRGVGHIRHKETDRIGDLACELRKLGAAVAEFDDGMEITPGPTRAAMVETYNDHRMAMSLAIAGLRQPGVTILNPSCTKKTYPRFFEDLARLTE